MKLPANHPAPWEVHYNNDVSVGYDGDEGFWEWWEVLDANGAPMFKSDDEELCKWLVEQAKGTQEPS